MRTGVLVLQLKEQFKEKGAGPAPPLTIEFKGQGVQGLLMVYDNMEEALKHWKKGQAMVEVVIEDDNSVRLLGLPAQALYGQPSKEIEAAPGEQVKK